MGIIKRLINKAFILRKSVFFELNVFSKRGLFR